MPPQISLPELASFHETQRFLEQVVVGVSEGWLQVLPLLRLVIKELLVIAALSPGAGINHSVIRVSEQSISERDRVSASRQSRVASQDPFC